MGTIRGASAQRGTIVVDCAAATSAISQTSPANATRQIAPLPAAQINIGGVLNASTGVFTPALTGRYRISGVLVTTQSNAGASAIYLSLYQSTTALRTFAAAANINTGGTPCLSFSQIVPLVSGSTYNLRLFSTLDSSIIEMQLTIEYVSP